MKFARGGRIEGSPEHDIVKAILSQGCGLVYYPKDMKVSKAMELLMALNRERQMPKTCPHCGGMTQPTNDGDGWWCPQCGEDSDG